MDKLAHLGVGRFQARIKWESLQTTLSDCAVCCINGGCFQQIGQMPCSFSKKLTMLAVDDHNNSASICFLDLNVDVPMCWLVSHFVSEHQNLQSASTRCRAPSIPRSIT